MIAFLHIERTGGKACLWAFRHFLGDKFKHIRRIDLKIFRDEVQLVQGHFNYSDLARLNAEYYITILRHPVIRAWSHFKYINEHPEHLHHNRIVEGGIDGFIEMGIYNNFMTRLLTGNLIGKLEPGAAGLAFENLKKFSVIGDTGDGLFSFWMNCVSAFNWPKTWVGDDVNQKFFMKPHNGSLEPKIPSATTLRRFAVSNGADMELYSMAARAGWVNKFAVK